jgi:hypothetical protein
MRFMQTFLLLCAFVGVLTRGSVAYECSAFQNSSSSDLIAFLENSGGKITDSNAECVVFSIQKLGKLKEEKAARVLTRYLDQKRPLTADEKESERLHMSMSLKEFYPAVSALFEIGKPAVPALLSTIANDTTSVDARNNAVRAEMLIYRDTPVDGIRALKGAAGNASSPADAERINGAIQSALKWCGRHRQAECRAAAKDSAKQ